MIKESPYHFIDSDGTWNWDVNVLPQEIPEEISQMYREHMKARGEEQLAPTGAVLYVLDWSKLKRGGWQ